MWTTVQAVPANFSLTLESIQAAMDMLKSVYGVPDKILMNKNDFKGLGAWLEEDPEEEAAKKTTIGKLLYG